MYEERTVTKRVVFEGKVIRVRKDDAVLPDGRPCTREVVEHRGGACVLAVTEGKVILVKQFRYAYGETLLEIPAGKIEEGEQPEVCAMRELEEETGYAADRLELLQVMYPTPGYCNEKIYIYEAKGLKRKERHLDDGEFLDVCLLPLGEAYALLDCGALKDGKTALALLRHRTQRNDIVL